MKDLMVTVFIIGVSFIVIAFLGTTEFGRKFELITNSDYSDKIPTMVLFTSGCLGTYAFLSKVWISEIEEKKNFYFMFGFSFLTIVGAVLLILWVNGVKVEVDAEYSLITFPTEVDEVTRNIRLNLLTSVSYLFFTLMLVAISCLVLGFYHLKCLNND